MRVSWRKTECERDCRAAPTPCSRSLSLSHNRESGNQGWAALDRREIESGKFEAERLRENQKDNKHETIKTQKIQNEETLRD